MINVHTLFQLMPEGCALCSEVKIEGRAHSALLIKAYSDWEIENKNNIYIEIKMALIEYKRAAPIIWMAKIFNDIFETYINWADESDRALIYNLQAQDKIPILIYRGDKIVRKLWISNALKDTATTIIKYLNNKTWDNEDFQESKKQIQMDYESPKVLWDALISDRGGMGSYCYNCKI